MFPLSQLNFTFHRGLLATTILSILVTLSMLASLDLSHLGIPIGREMIGLLITMLFCFSGMFLMLKPASHEDRVVSHLIYLIYFLTFTASLGAIYLTILPESYEARYYWNLATHHLAQYLFIGLTFRVLRIRSVLEYFFYGLNLALLLGLLTYHFVSLHHPLDASLHPEIPLTSSLFATLTPLGIAFFAFFLPGLQRVPKSPWASIAKIFHLKENKSEPILLWYAIILIHTLSLGLAPILVMRETTGSHFSLSFFYLTWIPCIFYTISHFDRQTTLAGINATIAEFFASSAKRLFVKQYSPKQQDYWAATMGLRATHFMINHDPLNEMPDRLTTTLAAIRRDEIKGFIDRISPHQLLQIKASDNQIIGVMDPENLSRPCVAALNLFACTYLDIIPLVERRLKSLTLVFPILDPEFARKVKPELIEEYHSKMEWLFHFDFNWVDQQILLTPKTSHYRLSVDHNAHLDRNRILQILRHRNRAGSFIWVGEQARIRLQMEAPHLAKIIEPLSIELGDGQPNKVIHLIKFEELIPRLQKYDFLDRTRSIIRDFGVDQETTRMIQMVKIQIDHHITKSQAISALEAIKVYDWRGFREKDIALRLVVDIFNEITQKQTTRLSDELHEIFMDTIVSIGYPGRILYAAHQQKRAIRNIEQMIFFCRKPKDPRFSEAWLFACSLDPQTYADDEALSFLKFLGQVFTSPKLLAEPLVRTKSIESFFNFARRVSSPDHYPLLNQLIERMLQSLLSLPNHGQTLCLCLDGLIYLDQQLEGFTPLSEDKVRVIWEHLSEEDPHSHLSPEEVQALSSRLSFLAPDMDFYQAS